MQSFMKGKALRNYNLNTKNVEGRRKGQLALSTESWNVIYHETSNLYDFSLWPSYSFFWLIVDFHLDVCHFSFIRVARPFRVKETQRRNRSLNSWQVTLFTVGHAKNPFTRGQNFKGTKIITFPLQTVPLRTKNIWQLFLCLLEKRLLP